MAKTVVGLMDSMRNAEGVVSDLERSGFDRGSINLIGSHRGTAGTTGSVQELKEEKRSETAEGAVTGAGAGAAVGGLAGFVAGLTALTIPGIGPALALGPLGAALAGAGVGAVAGGGIGALMKMGVPEKDAHYYLEGVKRGGILVAVTAPDDMSDQAAAIMERHGAIDIDRTAEHWKKEGWTGFQTEGLREEGVYKRAEMPPPVSEATPRPIEGGGARRTEDLSGLRDVGLSERASEEISPRLKQDIADERQEGLTMRPEPAAAATKPMQGMASEETVRPAMAEEVKAGRRDAPEGVTRAYGNMESVPIQENVSLREGHASVERRPVDRPVSEADRGLFKESSVEFRDTREEPVVSKEARVREEVLVGTESTQRTEPVGDTFRKPRVDLGQGGEERPQHGMAATGLNAEDEDFRRHYQTLYGGKGDFEAYRSAYHYADEDSEAMRFQGRDFSEVEEDLHRSWDRSHPAGSWSEFKEAIRYGWNKKRHI